MQIYRSYDSIKDIIIRTISLNSIILRQFMINSYLLRSGGIIVSTEGLLEFKSWCLQNTLVNVKY